MNTTSDESFYADLNINKIFEKRQYNYYKAENLDSRNVMRKTSDVALMG